MDLQLNECLLVAEYNEEKMRIYELVTLEKNQGIAGGGDCRSRRSGGFGLGCDRIVRSEMTSNETLLMIKVDRSYPSSGQFHLDQINRFQSQFQRPVHVSRVYLDGKYSIARLWLYDPFINRVVKASNLKPLQQIQQFRSCMCLKRARHEGVIVVVNDTDVGERYFTAKDVEKDTDQPITAHCDVFIDIKKVSSYRQKTTENFSLEDHVDRALFI